MIYIVVGGLLGLLGLAYGFTCYYKLWQFARQCQLARIVVAQKGRVRLNAPILEWLLWCNMLDRDKDANGRMLLNLNGMSVSIVKKSFSEPTPIHEFVKWILHRGSFDKVRGWQAKGSDAPQLKAGVQAKQGKWSATDETLVTRNDGEPK